MTICGVASSSQKTLWNEVERYMRISGTELFCSKKVVATLVQVIAGESVNWWCRQAT